MQQGRAYARFARPPFLSLIAALSLACFARPASAQSGDEPGQSASVHQVSASAYITYWSLDPTGYHPTILVKVENVSGRDLSAQTIRFQARFVDMRDGITTTAKKEIRQSFAPYQQIYVSLRAPQPFQLPIDINAWPPLECKVMCRVGNVDDEGTQTLLVTKADQVTMLDEDAYNKIGRMPDYSQLPPPRVYQAQGGQRASVHRGAPDRPLAASAGRLNVPPHLRTAPARPAAPPTLSAFVSNRPMPGIGDDFYDFEKAFGLPTGTDSKAGGWTWATFKHSDPSLTLLTGSRGLTGKVDVIIAQFPTTGIAGDSAVINIGRSFAGKLKMQKLGAPTPSVRYLPTGRTQIVTCAAPGYQMAFFYPRSQTGDSSNYVVILSRVPGAVETLIIDQSRHSQMLKPFAAFFGAG